jgi:hypothetical protein
VTDILTTRDVQVRYARLVAREVDPMAGGQLLADIAMNTAEGGDMEAATELLREANALRGAALEKKWARNG